MDKQEAEKISREHLLIKSFLEAIEEVGGTEVFEDWNNFKDKTFAQILDRCARVGIHVEFYPNRRGSPYDEK